MKILFVDDDDSLRQLFIMLLDNLSPEIKITECNSGNQAIDKIQQGMAFDLILSDYEMDNGTGGDFYNYLKKNNIKTPFALFTTKKIDTLNEFSDLKDRNSLNAFIQKPISPNKFKVILTDLLTRISPDYIDQSDRDYKKIRFVYLLRFNKVLCDIYLKLSDNKFVKFINNGDTYKTNDIKKYLKEGQKFLYIKSDQYENFAVMFSQTPFLTQDNNPSFENSENAVSSTLEIIHDLIRTVGIGATVVKLIDQSVKQISIHNSHNSGAIIKLLCKIRDRDDYINDHSYLTAYISISICNQLGWNNEENINKIVYAALLHDSLLDDPKYAIVADETKVKTDILNSEELELYMNHPVKTAELISESNALPKDVELIVAQHHENPEGTGFPRKLKSINISPLVAIFIVAHSFVYEMFKVDFDENEYPHILNHLKKRFSTGNYKQPINALIKQFDTL